MNYQRPKQQPNESAAALRKREREAEGIVSKHGGRGPTEVRWPTGGKRKRPLRIFNPTHRAAAALDRER